jgi:hypothetical protein
MSNPCTEPMTANAEILRLLVEIQISQATILAAIAKSVVHDESMTTLLERVYARSQASIHQLSQLVAPRHNG